MEPRIWIENGMLSCLTDNGMLVFGNIENWNTPEKADIALSYWRKDSWWKDELYYPLLVEALRNYGVILIT